jgi:hypothetical protein
MAGTKSCIADGPAHRFAAPMGIADFFRPKYRHSDIRVRTEAVRALSSDDAAILENIAKTDRDASVRRLAIEKISAAELLADIASSDSERGVADFAGARAASLWTIIACGPDADAAGNALAGLLRLGDHRAIGDVVARAQVVAIRRRALTEIRDPRALAELAKRDVPNEVRLEAVSRIDDTEVLRALATDTTQKEVGLAAIEKIDEADVLELIANKAKNKAVRQRARKIASEMIAADKASGSGPVPAAVVPDATKRRRAEKAQLLRQAESLAESFDFAKSGTQLAAIEAAYTELGAFPDDGTDDKFALLVGKFGKRKAAVDAKVAQSRQSRDLDKDRRELERAQAAQARAAAAAEQANDEIVSLVDPAHSGATERTLGSAADEAKRQARRAEAEARRVERDTRQAAEKDRRDAFEVERQAKQKAKLDREKAALTELANLVSQMEDALAGKKIEAAKAESAVTENFSGDSTEGVDPTVKRRRGKAPAAERLLEQAAKVYADVARVPESERSAVEARYHEMRAKLVLSVADKREAEDWARWTNVPQAESLIKVAKEMAEIEVGTPGAPNASELGGLLKELQQSWKEVGPLPQKKSKELWDTFKASCDQVFDKVRGQRAVAAEKYVEVAAAKQKLIDEALALSESTDWAATAERLKQLQGEWKTSGNLPRAQGDELWTKFRAACDKFFERRKPMLDARDNEENANLQRKLALIEQIQRVVAKAPGDGGWGKAIGHVKDAQAEWKEIGHVPRRDSDRIWNEFRTACDALFAKRDHERDAEANAQRAQIDAAKAEVNALMSPDVTDLVPRTLAVRTAIAELVDGNHKGAAELRTMVDKLDLHAMAHGGEALRGTALDPVKMKARRATLLSQAKELLPKNSEPGVVASGDVAAQLAAAMKKNAFGSLRFSGRDPIEYIAELRSTYASVGPLLDDEDRDAARMFADVCNQIAPSGATIAAPAAVIVATADAVTAPVAVTPVAAVVAAIAPPMMARKRSMSEPPPMDEVDSAWDLDDHRPQSQSTDRPDSSPPGAAEMAGDGGGADDNLDAD